ncbi:hypothetical protein Q669_11875 [Labrenzia sp. C1B10]|nr:hypothetical protein Q669_11875 [Labrenzia sp. C1B10]ERS07762.1 hypothetical protein Q675_20510 [Labrenzia sp. C1B70]
MTTRLYYDQMRRDRQTGLRRLILIPAVTAGPGA